MEFRKKTTATLLIAIFMISIFAVAIPVSAAATWYVDGDVSSSGDGTSPLTAFKTITEAIAAASDSDVIQVYAGTYTEDFSITVPNIELVAAETGVIIQGIATGQWPGQPANIDILADGVKIHGFTIKSPVVPSTPNEASATIILKGVDVKIYNNTFVSSGLATTDLGQVNVIQTWDVVNFATVDVSGLNIHDNVFTGDADGGYVGIYVNLDTGEGPVTISDNTFDGYVVQGIVTERSNTDITGNILSTNAEPTDYGVGIGVWDTEFGITGHTLGISDVLVSGNTISGSSSGFMRGIQIGTANLQTLTGITVEYNIVEDNGVGVIVRSSADGVIVNNNDIVDNVMGVENQDAVELDATLNWWGTQNHLLIAPMVLGDVLYIPWLDRSSTDLDVEVLPVLMSFTVTEIADFGTMKPGTTATAGPLIITNTGDYIIDITAELKNEIPEGFYTEYLKMELASASYEFVVNWYLDGLPTESFDTVLLELNIPITCPPGLKEATLVFWAEPVAYVP